MEWAKKLHNHDSSWYLYDSAISMVSESGVLDIPQGMMLRMAWRPAIDEKPEAARVAFFIGTDRVYAIPDSVTRCEHSAPTTIARPIRAGLGDVHDTLSRCVAECAQKVVAVRGDDDHFPRRS